ncbi:MAG TPA: FUSC family protein, partial [Candidatus Acidoferrum sp.]
PPPAPAPATPPSAPPPARAFWQTLTHFDATKLSAPRAFRNSVGVVLPLIVGFALQMPRGGLVVASGALNVSYSDGSDPYLVRAKRMLASTFLCALAVFAGAMSGRIHFFAVVLATAWAFIAGMFVALGGAAPDLGVISLVTLLIYSAQPLTPQQAAVSGLLALCGGLLQTVLSVALWPVHRYDPERRALANLYQELANRAATSLNALTAPPASVHSEQAQEALSALGRDGNPESMRYRALLTQAERIRLTLLILSRLRLRMERESHEHAGVAILTYYLELSAAVLREVSDALTRTITTGAAQSENISTAALDEIAAQLREEEKSIPPSFLAAVVKDAIFQMDALSGQLRAALDLAKNNAAPESSGDPEPLVPAAWRHTLSNRLEALRSNLNLQSPSFRHALRLATMVMLGDILGRSVSWRRSYWLPMTIVLVLKPEFTATFTRGLLRIAGTIVGLLLATGLFHFLDPSMDLQVIGIFIFVYLLRWLGPANYGVFGVLVSALIVLLLAVAGVPPKEVIWARGLNTALGGMLALLAYGLWPSWERTRVSERIAQMLDAYKNYIHTLVNLNAASDTPLRELDKSRRGARISRSNLEASIDRLSSEPGTARLQMDRLSAALASSHRLVHAAMALEAIFSQHPELSDSPPLKKFAVAVETTLTLLACALRGARVMPRDFPDLRGEYRLMIAARSPAADASFTRFDSINIEADRITNSLNTLAEQVVEWTRSPEFLALYAAQRSSSPTPSARHA